MLGNAARNENKAIIKAGLAAFGVAAFLGGATPNLFLYCLSAMVMLVGIGLLRQPGESPVLLFVVFFQWLQVSLKTFVANGLDKPIDLLSNHNENLSLASTVSLIAVLMLAFGMRLALGSHSPARGRQIRDCLHAFDSKTYLRLYLVALPVSMVAAKLAWEWPGLTQIFVALMPIKWAFFFALTYSVFARERLELRYWLPVFALEFALGFGGYFSEFKTVILFSFIGIFASGIKMSKGRTLLLAVLATLILGLGVVWTAIKPAYRLFVAGGVREQVVTVDYIDAMRKFGDLALNVDADTIGVASMVLLDRISYVDYFGAVLNYVPQVVPHENGALWLDALVRPFMPRLIFEDKTVIDDSERTRRYTGLQVSGTEDGTSIGIGYVGEAYIDFGFYAMMIPIFLFGMLLGWIYKWLSTRGRSNVLMDMGMGSVVVFSAAPVESSITKTIGSLIIMSIACLLYAKAVESRMSRRRPPVNTSEVTG